MEEPITIQVTPEEAHALATLRLDLDNLQWNDVKTMQGLDSLIRKIHDKTL